MGGGNTGPEKEDGRCPRRNPEYRPEGGRGGGQVVGMAEAGGAGWTSSHSRGLIGDVSSGPSS